MDSKLISVILYGFVGAALALVTTYFFIYNDEVYENTRFVESFKHPMLAAKGDSKKLQAMQSLKWFGACQPAKDRWEIVRTDRLSILTNVGTTSTES